MAATILIATTTRCNAVWCENMWPMRLRNLVVDSGDRPSPCSPRADATAGRRRRALKRCHLDVVLSPRLSSLKPKRVRTIWLASFRSPQVFRPTQIHRQKSAAAKAKPGKTAGMESVRSLFGIDAPEVVRDLDRMDAECIAFEQDYKADCGRDGEGRRGAWLAAAVKRYEAIDDLAGRLGSYAGLVHAGD